jgi:1-acyl-sn-glycerol-3-phosphate acyltransferase
MSQSHHGFGHSHTVLRGIAALAFKAFWGRVEVITSVEGVEAEELVPDEGTPMIMVANHWNSAADVRLVSFLSSTSD